jgi:hypothetical protein
MLDSVLKMLRYIGLLGFLGGLAALSAMWAFGPVPETVEQWRLAIGYMRPIFYACFFAGVVILVIAGGLSWWRHRREFHGQWWFRLMIGLLIIAVPTLHLWARSVAMRLYAAVDEAQLDAATMHWNHLGRLYVIGFFVMLLIAGIGIFKPHLGSRQ